MTRQEFLDYCAAQEVPEESAAALYDAIDGNSAIIPALKQKWFATFTKSESRKSLRGRRDQDGFTRASELLPAIIKPEHKPPSPIQERLISMPDGDPTDVVYQHSVLCQTCLPYRDPGDKVRLWKRTNGIVKLEVQAGRIMDPSINDFVDVGLPYGPKSRLVLYHLNAEALRTRSPVIELEDSLTAFVKRTLDLDPKGRNIKIVRDQLARLAGADFRLGATWDGRGVTVKGTVIEELELWTPKDPRQKVLWTTTVQFSRRYFESLMEHAVPLNEAAVSALSNSAMGLDVYTWMAQRFRRVPPAGQLVPWVCLKEQFGQDYGRIRDFRRVFIRTLKQVHAVYRESKFSIDGKGMRLHPSLPPVPERRPLLLR